MKTLAHNRRERTHMERTKIGLLFAVCVAAALGLAALPAAASPTVLGPTGLLATPTADTEGLADMQLGGWYVSDGGESVSLSAGAGAGGEGNATWFNPETGDDEFIFSGKWRFRQNSLTQPAVAIGIIDFSDEIDFTPDTRATPPSSARPLKTSISAWWARSGRNSSGGANRIGSSSAPITAPR